MLLLFAFEKKKKKALPDIRRDEAGLRVEAGHSFRQELKL